MFTIRQPTPVVPPPDFLFRVGDTTTIRYQISLDCSPVPLFGKTVERWITWCGDNFYQVEPCQIISENDGVVDFSFHASRRSDAKIHFVVKSILPPLETLSYPLQPLTIRVEE